MMMKFTKKKKELNRFPHPNLHISWKERCHQNGSKSILGKENKMNNDGFTGKGFWLRRC